MSQFVALTFVSNRNNLRPFYRRLIPEPLYPRTLDEPAFLFKKLLTLRRRILMADIQIFETTIAARQSGYTFRFLTIPNRSLSSSPDSNATIAADTLKEALNLQSLQPIGSSALPAAIMAMVQADISADVGHLQAQAAFNQYLNPVSPPPHLLAFAEEVAFAEIVPFEESPLSLVSLAGQVAGYAKSPIAMGAFIGVLAGGMTPLLLVTVPAGIIICGAASAFAKVVDERRDDLLSKMCGLQPKK